MKKPIPFSTLRQLLVQCYPHIASPTLEHCVPRSYFPHTRDAHNIILLPRYLNSHRSNYRLVESLPSGTSTQSPPVSLGLGAVKCTASRAFVPQSQYRGRYARAIAYVYLTYPDFRQRIERNVLSLDLMWSWLLEHRPSDEDVEASYRIAEAQGNENPLLTHHPDDALHMLWILVAVKGKLGRPGRPIV